MFRDRCRKSIPWIISLAVLLIFTACSDDKNPVKAKGPQGENAIANPSFEDMANNAPTGWKGFIWRGKPQFKYLRKGRGDSWCVAIHSPEGADASFQTAVPVQAFSRYRLSGWIRTAEVDPGTGRGALFNIHNIPPHQTAAVIGTRDWTRVEVEFDTDVHDEVVINCLLGGWGSARGKAWYDDLRLEKLSTRTLDPAVIVEADQVRAPISRYIYGQFIEHLGRCIYGGIWAEMLEDRKFFHPVGSEPSPWKILGSEENLTMSTREIWVGEHTPRISLAGDGEARGMAQEGLALVKGKGYTGRIILAGDPEAGPIEVCLVWGEGEEDRQTLFIGPLAPEYSTFPLAFEAGAATDAGILEIKSWGKGAFRVGTLSLMPADHVRGFRPDTLALLKELDAPVYRWPGGNFVSGYDWRDGIGDPDRRPPRKNPAWTGVEHNDVGIHEFMDLCSELNTEAYIAVNTGLGHARSVAEEVEYVNGGPDTPMGKLRAENGHPEPYGVKWWAVGNEMYGAWQLGHMSLEKYVLKHNEVAEAMAKVDPTLQRVGVGSVGPWSEGMLSYCVNQMEMISEHFYCKEKKGLMAHIGQIPSQVNRIAHAHREYRKTLKPLQGKEIPVAMDEWNYWYGPHVYGELGTRYFLKDALGIAAGLHAFFRHSDIMFMANYAQTVNVIGCIKTTKTEAAFATSGLVLKMYRQHFGTLPVKVTGAPEPLYVSAAWTEDKAAFTLAVINPTRESQVLALDLRGIASGGEGKVWRLTGPDEMAYNEPGKEMKVSITEETAPPLSDRVEAPALSVSLFRMPVQ